MKNVSRVSGISMNVLRTINQYYNLQVMNIVLDTNSLIMSIAPRSPYRKVWNAFLRGDYNLCVSNEIIEEYSEVLSRNISPQVSEAIVYAILTRPNVIRKDPHYTFALIEADKDDNKFVDCAIAANAKCIVTEDKHFKVLENIPFPKVEVIGIEDFKCYLDKWIQVLLDKNPERWLCYVLKHIDSTPEDKYYTLLPEFWEDEEQ